jgi:hypothetical protein
LSPFLNRGITWAIFQSDGNTFSILLALEAKQVTSVTFADISKAFDTVWVKALLYKLGKYGIKGDLLCWLKSYLSNRTQRVMIKDALSGIGHLLIIFLSVLSSCAICPIDVSSAKRRPRSTISSVISFMKIKNIKGPNTDP